MLAMSFASYGYDPMLCYIEIAVSAVTAGIVVISTLRFQNYISNTVHSTVEKINGFNPEFLDKYKIPVAVLGADGEIIWSNTRFRKQFCNGKNPEGDMISPYIGDKKSRQSLTTILLKPLATATSLSALLSPHKRAMSVILWRIHIISRLCVNTTLHALVLL